MTLTRRDFAAGGLVLAAGTEPDRARELLERVAERYGKMRAVWVRVAVRVTGGVSGGGFGPGASRESQRGHELLCAGKRARLAVAGAPGAKAAQELVDDGANFLWMSHHSRVYFQGASGAPESRGAQAELEKWKFHHVARFGRVGELDVERKLRGPAALKTQRGRVACEVVELKQVSRDLAWSERLWIEAETGLVWKAEKTWPPSRESLAGSTVAEVRDYDFEPAVGPEAFSTAAPAGYQRLERAPTLTQPQG